MASFGEELRPDWFEWEVSAGESQENHLDGKRGHRPRKQGKQELPAAGGKARPDLRGGAVHGQPTEAQNAWAQGSQQQAFR